MNFSELSKVKWLSAVVIATTLVGCSPMANPNDAAKEKATVPPAQTQGTDDEAVNKNTPAEKNPNRKQAPETRQPRYSVRAPQVGPNSATTKMNSKQQANYIAESVNRIPGVERSAVLVTGNTAIIGVDLKADIGGSRIDTIKYSVKETAENTIPKGMRAVVTADVDTVTRVRELIAGTRQGRPIDSLGDEIADIISRLLPEM